MVINFWHHIIELGRQYGVDPLMFACLYFAHHPLFWGTMAWLATRVRRHQSVAGVIALGVFFWFMPYTYVFVFGRGLPWWLYALAAVVIAFGGVHVIKEIRRRLQASPRPAATPPR